MSTFSDKSDFGDVCLNLYSPNIISSSTIYIGDVPLKVNSPKDLIPYYGHLIGSMGSSERGITIHLSKKSRPDYIDKDGIDNFVNLFVRDLRIAKRHKKELTFEKYKDLLFLIENDRKMLFEKCMTIKDFLIKHWIVFDYRKSNQFSYIVNDAIINEFFYDISLARSNPFREQLLIYASEWYGKGYIDWKDDIRFAGHSKDFIFNCELRNIYNKVVKYHKMCEKIKKGERLYV